MEQMWSQQTIVSCIILNRNNYNNNKNNNNIKAKKTEAANSQLKEPNNAASMLSSIMHAMDILYEFIIGFIIHFYRTSRATRYHPVVYNSRAVCCAGYTGTPPHCSCECMFKIFNK